MKIISRHLSAELTSEQKLTKLDLLRETAISNMDLQGVGITTPFVQYNHSKSVKNVLRSLHYQIKNPQGEMIRIIFGFIIDAVVDLRRTSPHSGKTTIFELPKKNGYLAWIPPGFAHGLLVNSENADVLYSVTDYRQAEHKRTLLWNAPTLAINWPLMSALPVLSAKDAVGTPFQQSELYD